MGKGSGNKDNNKSSYYASQMTRIVLNTFYEKIAYHHHNKPVRQRLVYHRQRLAAEKRLRFRKSWILVRRAY